MRLACPGLLNPVLQSTWSVQCTHPLHMGPEGGKITAFLENQSRIRSHRARLAGARGLQSRRFLSPLGLGPGTSRQGAASRQGPPRRSFSGSQARERASSQPASRPPPLGGAAGLCSARPRRPAPPPPNSGARARDPFGSGARARQGRPCPRAAAAAAAARGAQRAGSAHAGDPAHARRERVARRTRVDTGPARPRAPERGRAPRPPAPGARGPPLPHRRAGAREPGDVLGAGDAPGGRGPARRPRPRPPPWGAAPRGRGPSPPAPARALTRRRRRHRRATRRPRRAALRPRFRRPRCERDRLFCSQLPGRHLTFNPRSQWAPSAPLARLGAAALARPGRLAGRP